MATMKALLLLGLLGVQGFGPMKDLCDEIDPYLPSFCKCNPMELGADLNCSVDLFDTKIVAAFRIEPCDTEPLIEAEFEYKDEKWDYKLQLGKREQVDIPGLSFKVPFVGEVAAVLDYQVSLIQNRSIDDLSVLLGIDACGQVEGKRECGENITKELPFYIFNDTFTLSNFCNNKTIVM
eukprot:m.29722 g.29722  ORF g.29722 m.29722 type:complete len:179 (-) comp8131_c0_seq1:120-656(-)